MGIAHGTATSYACQNCCPDSFNDASCDPSDITGFPGDTSQLITIDYGNFAE